MIICETRIKIPKNNFLEENFEFFTSRFIYNDIEPIDSINNPEIIKDRVFKDVNTLMQSSNIYDWTHIIIHVFDCEFNFYNEIFIINKKHIN